MEMFNLKFKTFLQSDYGPLSPKVQVHADSAIDDPNGDKVESALRKAAYVKQITAPYSVDDQLDKSFATFSSFDGTEIRMKVYTPKKLSGKAPALVWFHGGAWIMGDIEQYDFLCSYLAVKAEAVCFNVEYRLGLFPTGLKDCYESVKYVVANAEKFGVDPERVAAGGASSGGNDAAAVALMSRDFGEFRLDKQVLCYACTDPGGAVEKESNKVYVPAGFHGDRDQPAAVAAMYRSNKETYYGTEENCRSPYCSMLLAEDLSNLAPALFIQPECDGICDDGLMYAQRLADAGNQVKAKLYKGMPHGFICEVYEETFEALDDIAAFLREE